jgi:hypothetical protein
MMTMSFAIPTWMSRLKTISFAVIALAMMAGAFVAPAFAIEIPSDDDQDVLIRSTLSTFNDANMTSNYAVLMAKSSKQFQEQMSADKLATMSEPFRTNKLFFESIVTDDYDSSEKAVIDSEGVLMLAGVFKGDEMQVTYKLRYIQNGTAWKLLGINVNAKKL